MIYPFGNTPINVKILLALMQRQESEDKVAVRYVRSILAKISLTIDELLFSMSECGKRFVVALFPEVVLP